MSDSIEHSKYYYEYDRNDPNRKFPMYDQYSVKSGISSATESDWNDFWENDGNSLVGNPYPSEGKDSIYIGPTRVPGALGEDHITFNSGGINNVFGSSNISTLNLDYTLDDIKINENIVIPDLPQLPNNNNKFWKYHEDVILKEIREYLGGTYRSHYSSSGSQTQTLDLIEAVGDAESFCRSNAIKYLSRFGKKDGKSKQDILKAIHYCILLYHFAGLCNENSQPYETF